MSPGWLEVSPAVRSALEANRPVLALESSVWAQGLPHPLNLKVAREACGRAREAGAEPAVIVLREGKARVGLSDADLESLCLADDVLKAGLGEMPGVLAQGQLAATTVSSTLVVAEAAGIQVLATGGLGGVHLQWNQRLDISADLGQLARTRCLTVCSGVKSVLDVTSSLEMLETLGIPLALYGTDHFPRFYSQGMPAGIGFRLDTPEEVSRAHRLALATLQRGLLVTQPCPAEYAMDSHLVERWVHEGTLAAEEARYTGKALTPFLLDYLARQSSGGTLEANRALLLNNVTLGARIAVALGNA